MNTSQFGKGCVQTPLEVKELQFSIGSLRERTAPDPDWDKGYMVEDGFTIPQSNQGATSRCTAEATCYYGQARNMRQNRAFEEYSRRFIYSKSYIPPDGGAYIWKAMSVPVSLGFAGNQTVPDERLDELYQRDQSDNDKAFIEAIAYRYAQIRNNKDMDYLANIIKQYDGFVTGFNGNDQMFDDMGNARVIDVPVWGHAVWICGYHLHDGKRCLIFKNSWGWNWGDRGYGHMNEDFVKSGLLFDAYVYAEIRDIIKPMKRVIQLEGTKDQYLVVQNKKYKIPDLATLEYLRDILFVTDGIVEVLSQDEFNKFTAGSPIASQAVDAAMARAYPYLRDRYEAE